MVDFNQQFGATSMPSASVGDSLSGLDPGRRVLLEVIKAGILSDLSPAWDDAKKGTSLWNSTPVETCELQEPSKQFVESVKPAWPALYVYSETPPKKVTGTTGEQLYSRTIVIQYLLGPLDPVEAGKLADALNYVVSLIHRIVEINGHPAYATTGVAPLDYTTPVLIDPTSTGFSAIAATDDIVAGGANFEGSEVVYYGARFVVQVEQSGATKTPNPGAIPHTAMNHEATGDESGDVTLIDTRSVIS